MNTDHPQPGTVAPPVEAWAMLPAAQVSRLAVAVDDQRSAHGGPASMETSAAAQQATTVAAQPDDAGGDVADVSAATAQGKSIEHLSTAVCIELLAEHHFGRLAFIDIVGVLPLITPVNYLFFNGAVVFRTDPGSKLTAAIVGAPVAFEVDSVDPRNRVGWSVVVRGHAQQVTDPGDLAALRRTPLVPWAPGAKEHYISVQPRQVSGRRISRLNLPSDWWG